MAAYYQKTMNIISPSVWSPDNRRLLLVRNIGRVAVLTLFSILAAVGSGYGSTATLSASDTYGQSSFNAGTHWSNSTAPSAGNDYTASGLTLRTPSATASASFLGNSLQIAGGGQLLFKMLDSGRTITVGDLILDNGAVTQNAGNGTTEFLAGNVTLGSGGGKLQAGFDSPTGNLGLTVSAPIDGSGGLTIQNVSTGTGATTKVHTVTLSGTNTYSGGTTVGTSNGNPIWLEVSSGSSLGTGPVTLLGYANALTASSTLRLNSASAIDDTAAVTLGDGTHTNWALNLNFSGTKTVSSVAVNGTSYTSGTVGALGTVADHTFSQITGAGILQAGGNLQPNLQTTFGDNFDSYSVGSGAGAFSVVQNGGLNVNTWTINAAHQYEAVMTNKTGIGGGKVSGVRGIPNVGGSYRKNFTYTTTMKVVSAPAVYSIGLAALAPGQPIFNPSPAAGYYSARMNQAGQIFLEYGNTTTSGLTTGTATNLGVALSTGTTYTFTLTGTYIGTDLDLQFTVTDGTHTASVAGTDTNPFSGFRFGYQFNVNTTAGSLTVDMDDFSVDVPMNDWTMTFDEEFNGTALNTAVWSHGWLWSNIINNELQGYVPENVSVANGVCDILVEKRTVQNTVTVNGNPNGFKGPTMSYASGAIQTYNKFTQLYGYFEARIKMPAAIGTWPAFWMLPDRGSTYATQTQRTSPGTNANGVAVPMGNEIDTTEYMAAWKNASGLSQSHSGFIWSYSSGAMSGYALTADGFGSDLFYANGDSAFHTYGVYWAPGVVTFYLDGKLVRTWSSSNVSVVPEYLLLNCALTTDDWHHGASAIPTSSIDAALPDHMQVDYVRVWTENDGAITMDNAAASGVSIVGSWTTSTAAAGYYGSNFLDDGNTGQGTKSVKFTPNIPATGNYQVFARWTMGSTRATNVPVTVVSTSGTIAQSVNQQTNGGAWVSLGYYTFNAGTSGSVTIDNTGANGTVTADAVKFVPQP
jgi:beta-glucanase (GH16 family)